MTTHHTPKTQVLTLELNAGRRVRVVVPRWFDWDKYCRANTAAWLEGYRR